MSGMSRVPEPPPMQRRWVQPGRLGLTLATLCVLPAIAGAGALGAQARASILHVALTYGVLILAFRLLGKRELSQLSPFELVTLMLIPEILSNSVQGQADVLAAMAGLSAVLLLVLLTSALSQRYPAIERALEAAPTLLVMDGKLLERNMNAERIAPDELVSEMRKRGIEQLEGVRFAVLEGDGNISFVTRSGNEL
jgi:uncharacterized membrane protein YcaP (DUF421 family)